MKSETGESTRTLRSKHDDEVEGIVLEHLRKKGASLYCPPKLDNYYVDLGNGAEGFIGCLSQGRVRKLEAQGVLRHVGICRYELANR